MKFATLVVLVLLMGSGMKYGQRSILQGMGLPAVEVVEGPKFSSEEADLMATVFQSAMRLFSGSATREELASELSDKLYAGRAEAGDMSELGIELVKPGGSPSALNGRAGAAHILPTAQSPAKPEMAAGELLAKQAAQPGAKSLAKLGKPTAGQLPSKARTELGGRIWEKVKPYSVELSLVPVVFLGMYLVHRIRRRNSGSDDFAPPLVAMPVPAESEPYDMKHGVHSLASEDFELLVALIYQRQGYRVSMPAGLSGGRGGDFMLARKAERMLVQCKKSDVKHRVPVERVRELHEAMTAAGVLRGIYVASCGFTWDARNFAKTRGITLINARTLDELIATARENPQEDLLEVSQWRPKFLSKVKVTPPFCPACGATMDQINASNGTVWLCSQRPECRGRRSARKHLKSVPTATRNADTPVDEVNA